ncbi:hypothetical protein M5689_019105 [Euphorbia peplus]|nr:hypothetical protein M5689_019105 [Euphorbia peplus]
MATSEQLCGSPYEENIDEDNPDMVIPIVSTSDTKDNELGTKPFEKKKRKKTSAVWVEFTKFKARDGTISLECIHCKSRLTKSDSGTTTHFLRHLRICQSRKNKLKGKKQLCLTTTPGLSENVITVENFCLRSC